jgi:hypothetical protein
MIRFVGVTPMNVQTEQWVGIDVSKADLDVFVYPQGKQWRSSNSDSGIIETVESETLPKRSVNWQRLIALMPKS